MSYPDPEDEYITINSAPFYSPTSLPVLLQGVNRESHSIALEHYPLCFPNPQGPHPARIRFNTELDTLYFPSWCFHLNLVHFELVSSPSTKNMIKRIARDNLMWFAPPWDEGTINSQITIAEFGNLQEYTLVNRGPDVGCGCCAEFDGPEEGVVDLRRYEEDGKWDMKCRAGTEMAFEEIRKMKVERGEKWRVPRLGFAQLLRDGVEV